MYYYALCSVDWHARDSVAYSTDLYNWTKTNEILIDVGEPGSIDDVFAHKPGITPRDGKLYHIFCAVTRSKPGETGEIENNEIRGISAANNGCLPAFKRNALCRKYQATTKQIPRDDTSRGLDCVQF